MHLQRLAPGLNAFRFAFDPALLAPVQKAYHHELESWLKDPAQAQMWEGGRYVSRELGDYHLFSYDTWPLFWFTHHSPRSYALFQRFFNGLDLQNALRERLDCRRRAVMYSGFWVIGNRAEEPMWHYDYRPGAQAYTLLTPLFALASGHGQLLCQDAEGHTLLYPYRLGEAILLGDGVLHSTQPYAPQDQLRVLLSLTCGSDKWQHWETIRQNIAEQSASYAQPCGHLIGRCRCAGWQRLLQRLV
ncbi:MAG: hypothetical protein ACO1RX_11685 [Candidatus Sericytochromatia bacterium]